MNSDSDSDSDYVPSTPSSSNSDITTWFEVIPQDHNIHIDEFGWDHDHILYHQSLDYVRIKPIYDALNDLGLNVVSHRLKQRRVYNDDGEPVDFEQYQLFEVVVDIEDFDDIHEELEQISDFVDDGPIQIPNLVRQLQHNRQITTTPVAIYTISKEIAPEANAQVDLYITRPLD